MKVLFPLLTSLLLLMSCGSGQNSKTDLTGSAEDLWGNSINLDSHTTGVTIIQPFSPANCGYCLIDGQFMAQNYLAQAEKRGGSGFHQCLFNPQLDIYAFQKHYRETDISTIVFPPHLHRYHRDGFPFLIAFKDGHKVFSNAVSEYESRFRSLSKKLWPDSSTTMLLAGSMKMASNFINENKADLSILVVPDGQESILKQHQERAKLVPAGYAVQAKYQSDLTSEDLALNLNFVGLAKDFDLAMFADENSPIHFQKDTFTLGPYSFPTATTALRICLPNPHNQQHYVFLELPNEEGKYSPYKGWLDFVVTGKTFENNDLEILLEGVFAKGEDNKWSWSEATVSSSSSLGSFCAGGVCPAPVSFAENGGTQSEKPEVPGSVISSVGVKWNLGSQACRFPDLAIDGDDNCWVTWEENGDILLALVSDHADESKSMIVEGSSADSYNPVLAWDGKLLWVAYVTESKGFYRLFGRYWDGQRLSPAMPISDNRLTDVITPAVTGDGMGKLAAVWTEWKANFRHLMTRTIDNGIRQPVHEVLIAPSEINYINAWYPSLVADSQGQVFGAWNQHYPANLGVCSGNLVEQAVSVTAVYGKVDENEKGGYPDITITADGERWVVWESFGWDVLSGDSQLIFASRYDAETSTWLKSEVVSDPDVSFFCQTPRLAALPDGKLCAVWSGRPALESTEADFGNWSVFMSERDQGEWTPARMLSKEGETARAPRVALDKAGRVWVVWHNGIGDEMRVEVCLVKSS